MISLHLNAATAEALGLKLINSANTETIHRLMGETSTFTKLFFFSNHLKQLLGHYLNISFLQEEQLPDS